MLKKSEKLVRAVLLASILFAQALPAAAFDFSNPAGPLIDRMAYAGRRSAFVIYAMRVKDPGLTILTICGLKFTELGIGPFEWKYPAALLFLFGRRSATDLLEQQHGFPPMTFAEYILQSKDELLFPSLKKALANPAYEWETHPWSRDPDKSLEEMPALKKAIKISYARASMAGHPFVLVTHSWGTVLAHQALNELANEGSDVRVYRLITLGSPLTVKKGSSAALMALETAKEKLFKKVIRPPNTHQWINLWAAGDTFSGEIPQADLNIQIDAEFAGYREELKRLLKTPARRQARKDLHTLNNLAAWHGSYILGYNEKLLSLNKQCSLAPLQFLIPFLKI